MAALTYDSGMVLVPSNRVSLDIHLSNAVITMDREVRRSLGVNGFMKEVTYFLHGQVKYFWVQSTSFLSDIPTSSYHDQRLPFSTISFVYFAVSYFLRWIFS